MIRLTSATFIHDVVPPANGLVPQSRAKWDAGPDVELQLEGAWVAVWTRGAKVPRLVPMANVRQVEPVETPKGFEAPPSFGKTP